MVPYSLLPLNTKLGDINYLATTANVIKIGDGAGAVNTGTGGIFLGYQAGYKNTSANNNVFIGSQAGQNNTTGRDNIFIGTSAGSNNKTGSENIYIGYRTMPSSTSGTGSGNIYIGTNIIPSAEESNTIRIYSNGTPAYCYIPGGRSNKWVKK